MIELLGRRTDPSQGTRKRNKQKKTHTHPSPEQGSKPLSLPTLYHEISLIGIGCINLLNSDELKSSLPESTL
jgi:hypothetical protein